MVLCAALWTMLVRAMSSSKPHQLACASVCGLYRATCQALLLFSGSDEAKTCKRGCV